MSDKHSIIDKPSIINTLNELLNNTKYNNIGFPYSIFDQMVDFTESPFFGPNMPMNGVDIFIIGPDPNYKEKNMTGNKQLTALHAQSMIRSMIQGQKATAFFIKKDGTSRLMNFRMDGMNNDIKRMIEDQSFMTITVFDIDANGIRRINLDTLQWLHFNGETFQIVQ